MKALLLFILVLSFYGCEKDPYPGNTALDKADGPGGRIGRKPPGSDIPVPPGNAADIPAVMKLEEGKLFTYKLRIVVPKPGKPVVWIDNLPPGASFDAENLVFKWTPGYFTGNDPQDPSIKTMDYIMTVRYKSSEDEPTDHKFEKVTLKVSDVPQKFDIVAKNRKDVKEGETLYYNFKVENFDYPQGPFKITTKGMPANTMVEQIDTNNFRLVFKPDHQHVKLNDNPNPCSRGYKDCLLYEGKIVVTNPAHHITQKDVEIEVKDVRKDISIVTPSNMQQGLDISFSISVVDPNGEVAPVVSMLTKRPRKGEFKTTLQKDEENNLSVFNVTWKDIPPTFNGKSRSFQFKACVLDGRGRYQSCDQGGFRVTIVVKDRKPPMFERSSWAQGEIKYLRYNESAEYKVSVKDGDNRASSVTDVVVKPDSMQKYVHFVGQNLMVKIDKPGIHQFSLVATSDYNLSSAESFVVEVFPKSRSNTLYFTDSTRDKEVQFYRDVMGNVELYNPVLQPLTVRNLSGRTNLILGTGILEDVQMKDNIQDAMKMINNVVVASPLLENMPDSFIDQLTNDYKISILGRYSELANTPSLDQMYFVVRSDFMSAKDKVQLSLNSTKESFDPLIFSISVDRENCQDVMDFTNRGNVQRASQFKIGLICNRHDGKGRFAILGTEFADLKTSERDTKVPGKWLRTMLTTKLSQDKQE